MALMPNQLKLAVGVACVGLVLGTASAQAVIWPSATRRAERELASPDVAVRQAAVGALASLPRASARRLLLLSLDDVDAQVASAALELLLRLETPKVTERIVPWLSGSDKKLRLSAALALAVAPAPNATAALGRALGDSDPEVRAAAAAALGASASAEAVLPLLGHLDDAVPEVREAVASALGALGDARAVLPLIGKVEDPRPSVRAAVARALGVLRDSRSSSALMLALRDSDRAVVVAVVRALGRLGEQASVSPLGSLLASEPESEARRVILFALGSIANAEAARLLVQELASDEPGREREPVLTAIVSKPAAFAPALRACLESAPTGGLAEGCALGLAAIHDLASAPLVRAALDRGKLSPKVGLFVLGRLGDSRSLSAALERLTAPDAETRTAAMDAAEALLSPIEVDGRAVEPIVRALAARGVSRTERLRLVTLLGRTGSERALATLVPLLQNATDPELGERSALALGHVPSKAAGSALLVALDAEEARVQRAAALSIRRQQRPELLGPLLLRFERGGATMRALVALSIFGPLAKSNDDALISRAVRLLGAARGGERDALIEALATSPRAPGRAALLALAAGSDVADRAKVAEVLAARRDAGPLLERLLRDPDPRVKANAAWSMGFMGPSFGRRARELLLRVFSERDAAVVGNAAVSLGRLSTGQAEANVSALCEKIFKDARASVREQALRGLLLAQVACANRPGALLLARDPRARVRRAAAELLLSVGSDAASRRLLARCEEADTSAVVAEACGGSPRRPNEDVDPITVLVVPAGSSEPAPGAAFALLLSDGSLRLGSADRRGGVHEPRAARGPVELLPYASGD